MIPTPRRFLLMILMVTGISTLTLGILAQFYILTKPTLRRYTIYCIYETTLLIIFANLPFLTSLVVTTTPARIREFSRNFSVSRDGTHMSLPPWPHSRQLSVQNIGVPSMRSSGMGSAATVTSGVTEKKEWMRATPVTRPENAKDGLSAVERPGSGKGWPLP
ncbi:hypothetical protein OPT61_g5927 [Boeremia exigua]|uniref:Uncharacterized protein n=1 Tax=Boeremia exigua TaxID=749465 RepID=A0ACC2I8I4_9PLEO|nr:hypothetical protein OPT61_g5927 [Boeremia exigua]